MSQPLQLPDRASFPRHVAVIMDGNGRWAQQRGMPRIEGHRRGADVVRDITTYSRELDIPYLTLYSFSVQNWRRPPEEVAGLMQLLEEYCEKERDTLMNNEIRLATIGRTDRLPPSTQRALAGLLAETAGNDKMTLTLAIDYGGREELVEAARRVARMAAEGTLDPAAIDEALVGEQLHTAGTPDPDLVIRTSGECRVSNFLLWQIAYAEFVFDEQLWPEFTRERLAAALREFAGRQRRFGATEPSEGGQGEGEC